MRQEISCRAALAGALVTAPATAIAAVPAIAADAELVELPTRFEYMPYLITGRLPSVRSKQVR
jgi:hypothetical protein